VKKPVEKPEKKPAIKPVMKLSVVMPAFNEAPTICRVLDRISEVSLAEGFEMEVLVINDGSTDQTRKNVETYIAEGKGQNVRLINHERNMGKGSALHTGIREAEGDYVIIQDADMEYDPHEYNDLLKPVAMGFADVVYGSRFMGSNPHRILFFWHSIGNRFLTFLSNAMTNLNLTDMETCYKLFDRKILQSLELREKGFGFEPEVTSKIARIPGIRIYEVGISYYGRTYAEGKKICWKDGFRAIYAILKYGILG
jgi:glycosyltransferase involved in cell wall biosynthesis